MLTDPSTKDTLDKLAGPNGVRYRGVPLYMHIHVHVHVHVHVVESMVTKCTLCVMDISRLIWK